MRMRKLGKGQSVVFCVPEEINTKIRERRLSPRNDAIGVKDVLCWALLETCDDLKRKLLCGLRRVFDSKSRKRSGPHHKPKLE